ASHDLSREKRQSLLEGNYGDPCTYGYHCYGPNIACNGYVCVCMTGYSFDYVQGACVADIGYGSAGAVPITSTLSVAGQCDDAGIQTCLNAYQAALEGDATIVTDSARFCPVFQTYVDCIRIACGGVPLSQSSKTQFENSLQQIGLSCDIGYGSAGAVPITSTLSVAGQCDDAGIQTCLNAYQAALEGDATIVTDSARFCPVFQTYVDCIRIACGGVPLSQSSKTQFENSLQQIGLSCDIGYGSAGAVPITSTLSVAGQCDDAGIQTCLNAYQAALEGDATIVTDSARFCPVFQTYVDCIRIACGGVPLSQSSKTQFENSLQQIGLSCDIGYGSAGAVPITSTLSVAGQCDDAGIQTCLNAYQAALEGDATIVTDSARFCPVFQTYVDCIRIACGGVPLSQSSKTQFENSLQQIGLSCDIGYESAGAVPITSTLSVAGQCDDAGIQTCLNAYQAALEGDATIVTDSARFCPVFQTYVDCIRIACGGVPLSQSSKTQFENSLQQIGLSCDIGYGSAGAVPITSTLSVAGQCDDAGIQTCLNAYPDVHTSDYNWQPPSYTSEYSWYTSEYNWHMPSYTPSATAYPEPGYYNDQGYYPSATAYRETGYYNDQDYYSNSYNDNAYIRLASLLYSLKSEARELASQLNEVLLAIDDAENSLSNVNGFDYTALGGR
ncbi:hypothetical protein BaRGS_00039363, partial [Batillaria attramentaria]